MTIWCRPKHFHKLELQKFFLFFVLRIYQLGYIWRRNYRFLISDMSDQNKKLAWLSPFKVSE